MAMETLVRAKYAGLDFDTHVDDLLARLQVKFAADFNDFAVSSLAIVVLDAISYGLDTLSFYLDRRATDAFLTTARTRRSVSRLCRQLGYKMGAAIGSSTDLTVSVQNPQAFAITIPKGFQFRGPSGLIFEAAEAVTFPAGSGSSLLVPVYQGETTSETFVSDGQPNQVFELTGIASGNYVAGGTVVVLVDGVPYEEREFLEFAETEQVEVGYNDDPPTLRFGNGAVGKIPPTGSTITVWYTLTRGKSGQVNKNTIQAVVAPLVVAFTPIRLAVDNPSSAVGGDDVEDLEHAKAYAPGVWNSRKVAVTRGDYEALAGSYADPLFGRVAVAQALSPRTAEGDIELQNAISDIQAVVGAPLPVVQSASAALQTSFDSVRGSVTTASTALAEIANQSAQVHASDAETAINGFRAIKNEVQEVDADRADIDAVRALLASWVGAFTPAGTSFLTAGDIALVQGWAAGIGSEVASLSAHVASLTSVSNNGVLILGQLKSRMEIVGLDVATAGSQAYVADQALQAISAQIGIAAGPTGSYAQVAAIQAVVVDTQTEIDGYLADIHDHVDRILSADCQANVVTVPILSRDSDGFYAPPSFGLVKSLQGYLEERNEVTQTVSVVSGALYLVPAVVDVEVYVLPDYKQTVVETAVRTTVENLHKNRKFGQSLTLSALFKAVEKVAGVGWHNVTIRGYYQAPVTDPPVLKTDKLDAEGNLILTTWDVLTRGVITVVSRQLTFVEAGNLIR